MTLIPQAILPPHIDSTMVNCFRSCPRKFWYEYILGLRPPEPSIDLHAGAVFSQTLKAFYKEVFSNKADTNTARARAYAEFQTRWGGFIIRKDKHPKTPENMWNAVEDYIDTYPPTADHVQPYPLGDRSPFEYSFSIPLDDPEFPRHPVSGDPFIYVGRFDLLGIKNGRPVVRDEKTASRLESNWSEKWDLRSQFLGYCWALQRVGIPCSTVVVRGVIVTLTSIRQVEAEKIYPQHLIDRWFIQLRRDLEHIVDCYNDAYFDYNLGDTCTVYNHCPFIPLCSSNQPENWYDSFEVRRWNPLARDPTAPTAPSGNGTERDQNPFSENAPMDSGRSRPTPDSDAITS